MPNDEKIKPGFLVVVLNEGADPPIQLGLIISIFPGGDNYNVQVGPTKKDKAIIPLGKVNPLIQTDGKFEDPKDAFAHYRDDIILEMFVAIHLTREYQAIKRLKERQKKLNHKLRYRIGRGLSSLLSWIPSFRKKS